ncbi:MAG: molybdopterin-dependent oxidoreductase, partial [Steroidobacteraceae bacterium]
CRLCSALCGIVARVENGRVVAIDGDPDNPLYEGYACSKGRQIPAVMNSPQRLLRSMKRQSDGSYAPIDTQQALDEIAARLEKIIRQYGPRSVAIFSGGYTQIYAHQYSFSMALKEALDTPMLFTNATIDQPGKPIARALHGQWEAGRQSFESSDTWLLVGANPIISQWGGIPPNNPAKVLKDGLARGLRLIVIDPRRTEVARHAAIHLQAKPGEDPAILASMIRVILDEELYDRQFVADEVEGLERLVVALQPYTPEYAARRAGVPASQIVAAARLFAQAKRGCATAGTGPNMSTHGTLSEYLTLVLTSLCGRWMRVGELLPNPLALLPLPNVHAQALPRTPAWGFGEKMRVRGLQETVAGPPTSALADEILTPGPGQVKALIGMASNAVVAWPDQAKVLKAFDALELSVATDIVMSATARVSEYVIAAKTLLEVPCTTREGEVLAHYWSSGYERPYAQYTPSIVEPPADSDLLEPWELCYGLAQRLGLQLVVEGKPLDMQRKPSSDEVIALLSEGSRVPLEEIKRYPHGHIFSAEIAVQPKMSGCTERLDVGNSVMMSELQEVIAEESERDAEDAEFPYRLICRRMMHVFNSTGRHIPKLMRRSAYNPAFMNRADAAKEGIADGDMIEVNSGHACIKGIVKLTNDLRSGTISMAHGFGDVSLEDHDVRSLGSPTGRLINVERKFDPYSGIPRMSAVPVRIKLLERGAVTETST